jgi:hypothetical protein
MELDASGWKNYSQMDGVTFFDARLSRGTSGADSRVLVSRVGSGIGQDRGSGEFSGRANGSGKGD